jgi:hypothetical protein
MGYMLWNGSGMSAWPYGTISSGKKEHLTGMY